MAKVQNTLIGRASGSVGGATFTTWKGINVLKSKPESVANPKTIGQRSQRSRLTIIVAVYRLISGLISVGFKSRAIGKSAYNAFVSQNIVNATNVDSQGVATIDYPELSLAKGTIGANPITSLTIDSGSSAGTVEFSSANPVGGAGTDIANVAIYNETQNAWTILDSGFTRSDAQSEPVMSPLPQSGDVMHAYLFFKSADTNDVSDSVYRTLVVA